MQTIKKRADFLSVTAKGKRFITGSFILQMLKRDDAHFAGPEPRFGFTVTKKMGNAPTRNRIKRRLRESVRLCGQLHALSGHDYVVIPRHKALTCDFAHLTRDMEFAFSRIPSMKDEAPGTRDRYKKTKAQKTAQKTETKPTT